jgi:hypothetical protein
MRCWEEGRPPIMTKDHHILHRGPLDSLQSSVGYKVMLTAWRGEVGGWGEGKGSLL